MIFVRVKVWRNFDDKFKEVLISHGYRLEKVECKNRHSESYIATVSCPYPWSLFNDLVDAGRTVDRSRACCPQHGRELEFGERRVEKPERVRFQLCGVSESMVLVAEVLSGLDYVGLYGDEQVIDLDMPTAIVNLEAETEKDVFRVLKELHDWGFKTRKVYGRNAWNIL